MLKSFCSFIGKGRTMINLAINGFGRIGRSIMRVALEREDVQIVAINDVADWEILTYLLEHDSTHQKLPYAVDYQNHTLCFDFDMCPPIHTLSYSRSEDIDFKALGADIVIESSGHFLQTSQLTHHLQKDVQKVILSASALDSMPTFIKGINEKHYQGEKIISNSSCTANAIAPICKILHDAFGIESATLTTIHSYTNDQSLLDSVYTKDKRRSRAAAQNIIPTSTGAAKEVMRVLPHLLGKLHGYSVRVPVSNIVLFDMSFTLCKPTTTEILNETLSKASENEMFGVVGIDTREGVSSDFINSPYSVVIAQDLSHVFQGNIARVMAWCDNEWGYAHRILDLAALIGK